MDITADFTLTFQEFAEGYRLQRARKRFLSGAPERSPWVGCAWIGGIFILLATAVIVATVVTGHEITSASGKTTIQSDAKVVNFLTFLLPWPIIAGLLWLAAARSILERRMLKRIVLIVMLIGVGSALSSTLSPTPPSSPATTHTTAESTSSLLGILPLLIGMAGAVFLMVDVQRRTVRVAWDGQPQLRQPYHLEINDQRILVQTLLSSAQYSWPAVVSFSESERLFLISLSAFTFHIIPKRALDGGAIESLRALLQSRTVRGDGTARAGFAVIPKPVVPLPPSAGERPRG